MSILKTSFDNITICGNVSAEREYAFVTYMNTAIHISIQSYTQTYIKGTMLNNLAFFEYDKNKEKINRSTFRIEFNPNKLSQEHLAILQNEILPLISNKHLTRLDLAIDFDIDLSSLVVTKTVQNTKTKKYLSENGTLETLYIGSRGSNKQLRMYNKKLERDSNDDNSLENYDNYWRIEFQLRHEATSRWLTVVDDYEFITELNLANCSALDSLILKTIAKRELAFSSITDRNERERLRRLYKKCLASSNTDIKNQIQEELTKKAPQLLSQLEELLTEYVYN